MKQTRNFTPNPGTANSWMSAFPPQKLAHAEDPQVIQVFLENLCSVMKTSAEENLPNKQFKRHKRPGWNQSTNTAHRRSWYRWKQVGRPMDPPMPGLSTLTVSGNLDKR